MKFRELLATLAVAAFAFAQSPASAHETVYTGALLGSNESPVANTPGTGIATVTIDFDLLTMHVEASFSDLVGNVTASHIHCCTAVANSGNVGVATQTPSFIGFPTGVTSGTYDHTFDMSAASSYNGAFITANGGTVGSAFNALVAGMDAGKSYFNIHTTSYPGGEVRALLSPVPEPSSMVLMLAGLGMAGALVRKKRSEG